MQRHLPWVLLHVFGADLVPEATLPDVLGMCLSFAHDLGQHIFGQRPPAQTVPVLQAGSTAVQRKLMPLPCWQLHLLGTLAPKLSITMTRRVHAVTGAVKCCKCMQACP